MNNEVIVVCLASCDERIASIQDKLSCCQLFGTVLKLANLEMKTKHQVRIQNYENDIKLIQIEKLIYKSLLKAGSKPLFPKLLAKYDELLGVSYDLSGNMVQTGLVTERDHLEYYNQSLEQREYIKNLCLYGERR